MVPDGPKGPPRKSKPGTILGAARTDTPIFAIAFSIRPVWRAPSWDGTRFPLPGSQVIGALAGPLNVPRELNANTIEEYQLKLDDLLEEAEEEARRAARGV